MSEQRGRTPHHPRTMCLDQSSPSVPQIFRPTQVLDSLAPGAWFLEGHKSSLCFHICIPLRDQSPEAGFLDMLGGPHPGNVATYFACWFAFISWSWSWFRIWTSPPCLVGAQEIFIFSFLIFSSGPPSSLLQSPLCRAWSLFNWSFGSQHARCGGLTTGTVRFGSSFY